MDPCAAPRSSARSVPPRTPRKPILRPGRARAWTSPGSTSQPRHARGPREQSTSTCVAPVRRGRARGRHPGRPAGSQDPAGPLRRRPGDAGRGRRRSRSPPATCRATRRSRPRPTTALRGRRDRRRLAAHRRRQRAAARVEVTDGRRVRCTVVEGGRLSNNKGINLPGVRVSAPRMTRRRTSRPALRARAGRRPGRAVVRARRRRRHRACTRSWTSSGVAPPGASPRSRSPRRWRHLEDDRRRVRRDHGGARRPRRGDARSRGAAGAEARHRARAAAQPSR